MSNHAITLVDAAEARKFWEQQEDARIFLHPDVLGPLCERVDWWLATWKGRPACLWPICYSSDGRYRLPELSSYVGPLWHDAVGTNKAHRWWTITRTVQQAFMEVLVATYGEFEFELPPGSQDVRVFQWFAEEHGAAVTVEIECLHTAIICSGVEDFQARALEGFSRDKRRNFVDTEKAPPVVWIDPADDELYQLYERLLAGKDSLEVARRRQSALTAMLGVARSGMGNILAYCDQDGEPAGFSLSLFSRKSASFVVIAVSEKARLTGIPGWLNMQGILANSRKGAESIDFLGANSLVGADEKHRFGAWPQMYFNIAVSRR